MNMEYMSRVEELEMMAQQKNARIDIAGDDVLQIDLDSPEALDRFWTLLSIAREFNFSFLGQVIVEKSLSPGHYHAYVKLNTSLDEGRRIFWQAMLGSDTKREMLNMARHRDGVKPNVLFFKPAGPPKFLFLAAGDGRADIHADDLAAFVAG